MDSTSDNQVSQSTEEFAQHLRKRAEQAAAASVQHASLSEKYLVLSDQFASLAAKAAATPGTDLATALNAIESAMNTVGEPTDSNVSRTQTAFATESPVDFAALQASQQESQSGSDAAEFPPADSEDASQAPIDIPPANSDLKPSPAESHDPAHQDRVPKRQPRAGRARTRKFVERVRSVKLAVARRVRIKANKEDLKPQQRTAMDELNKGRGSIVSSIVLSLLAMFILSLITLRFDLDIPQTPIMAAFADEISEIEEPQPIEMPEEEVGEQQKEEIEEPVEEPEPIEEPSEDPPEEEATAEEMDAPEAEVEESEITAGSESEQDIAAVDNRSSEGRKQLLEKFGGSAASESAVQRGLEWLASVQQAGGWWDFTHVGNAGNAGSINNPIGGTAYALLPFLAAGQTHKEGSYKRQVKAGLDYLTGVGIAAPAGYDLRGVLNKGNKDQEPNEAYYVHGAATLVLCEAYGMTKDRRLKMAAEGALSFLLNSQDPRGGGWRYLPQQPGSTSVTAIQVMALVAAQKAKMKIPDKTLEGVMHYLDSVQVDKEGRYAYRVEKKTFKSSATAMALLCRMYLGWERDDGDMKDGVAILDKAGPFENMYTTYFATQVMRNWGGQEWSRWNERMQQDLVGTQVAEGPGKGSWKPRSGMHTRTGGRLLETSLATLTLEVYYRYKPVLPEPDSETAQLAAE